MSFLSKKNIINRPPRGASVLSPTPTRNTGGCDDAKAVPALAEAIFVPLFQTRTRKRGLFGILLVIY